MRGSRTLRAAAAVRRLVVAAALVVGVAAASLQAFDAGYGSSWSAPCGPGGCTDDVTGLAPALARLVQEQEGRGLRCSDAPRPEAVVVVDDGRGGASLLSLAEVVEAGPAVAGRTRVYCA